MPTETPFARLASLAFAVALIAGMVIGGGLRPPPPWDTALQFTAFSLITRFLWRGSGLPLLAFGGVAVLAALDAWRAPGADAAGFLAALGGALATAALLGRGATRRGSPC